MSHKLLHAFTDSSGSSIKSCSSSFAGFSPEGLQSNYVRYKTRFTTNYVNGNIKTPQVAALRALECAVAALCECEQYLELAQRLNDIANCEQRLLIINLSSARRQKAATSTAKRRYRSAIESWHIAQRHLPLLPTWPTNQQPKGVHDVSAMRLLLHGRAASTVAKQRFRLDSSCDTVKRLRDATTAAVTLLRRSQRGGGWIF